MDSKEQYQQDFLWATYFGVTREEVADNKEERISRCIDRAYLDLNRTIKYRLSSSTLDEMKKAGKKSEAEAFEAYKDKFREDVRGYLTTEIKCLIEKENVEKKWFDDEWHKPVCQRIAELANTRRGLIKEGNNFTFGQAQKWVNMTLKNLLVMGIDDMNATAPVMHVPLDSYIIEAAHVELGKKIHESFDVEGLGIPKLAETWSGLDDPIEYIEYQNMIRRSLGKNKYPIYWEGPAWIAQAKVEAEK